jgi:hypothetical protein
MRALLVDLNRIPPAGNRSSGFGLNVSGIYSVVVKVHDALSQKLVASIHLLPS